MKTNCSPTSPKSGSLDSNENRAERTEAERLTINAAEQSQLQNDSAAEAAYQTALDGYAETQAMSDAAATLTYNDAIDAALKTQSNADAAAAQTYAHSMNGFTQQYYLAMGDAYAAEETSFITIWSSANETIDNAAASAWTTWGSAANSPYAEAEAAYNAASYNYAASLAAIYASVADTAAINQWNHDVAGGWLTYHNDLADHAKTDNYSVTSAAKTLTDALAADANTFATTVIPAIQTAADAEIADGQAAILTGSSAALADVNTKAGDALTAANTQIAAAQTVNDAAGDSARQEVNSDATASGFLMASAIAAMDEALGITPATDSNSQTHTSQNAATAQPNSQSPAEQELQIPNKATFDERLRQLVVDSALAKVAAHKIDGKKLYTADSARPGFDCDDFANAMGAYLSNNFMVADNATISYLAVRRVNPNENNQQIGDAHMIVLVVLNNNGWVIDPQRGVVIGPLSTGQWIEAYAKQVAEAVQSIMADKQTYRWTFSENEVLSVVGSKTPDFSKFAPQRRGARGTLVQGQRHASEIRALFR